MEEHNRAEVAQVGLEGTLEWSAFAFRGTAERPIITWKQQPRPRFSTMAYIAFSSCIVCNWLASVLENFPLGSGSYITNSGLLSREYRDVVRYRWDGRPVGSSGMRHNGRDRGGGKDHGQD
jgi:hypothetical protein